MDTWVDLARGPVFRAALTFAVLGLLRHVAVTAWEIYGMAHRAGDKSVAYRRVITATLEWLFPISHLRQRALYGLTTLTFHLSVIIVPIFLAGHVTLVRSGTGLGWAVISNNLADLLTLTAIATAVLLLLQRVFARDTRTLSRVQDYAIPVLVAIPFVSGFLMSHPAWNPIPFATVQLIHFGAADVLLLSIPVTKLSHMVLLPTTQLVSELAWHLPPDAGRRVGSQLGREGEPI
jgi:nitrate reductase gamma subunit